MTTASRLLVQAPKLSDRPLNAILFGAPDVRALFDDYYQCGYISWRQLWPI